jgi:hypothetical protein
MKFVDGRKSAEPHQLAYAIPETATTSPSEAVTDALYLLSESLSLDDGARQFLAIAQDELAKIRQIATATLGLHRGDADSPQPDITRTKLAEQSLRNSKKLAIAGRMAATVAHEINNLPVKVSELIDNVLSLYGRKLRSLGIVVDTRYDSNVPVNAFPGELRQVFSNLIVNAADALDKSGDKLCIHVFESVDRRNRAQRGLRITISDNGSGIPGEHLFGEANDQETGSQYIKTELLPSNSDIHVSPASFIHTWELLEADLLAWAHLRRLYFGRGVFSIPGRQSHL